MKKLIKTTALVLSAVMIFCFAGCTKKEETTEPEVETIPLPEIEPEKDPSADLKLTLEEWPVIDGALAMIPYYEEMAARILDLPIEEARKHVLTNNTVQAYQNLADGTVDMIFCAPPSDEQVAYAKEQGVEFESVQVLNSGFVFFVNKSNPVENLTTQQLHDIYAGKITNWKEVGGNDEEIIAYQRGAGSGSQTGLYEHLISEDEVMEPPTEQRIGPMSEIIDAVANYDNASGAIGFSYYYYLTNMHYQESVKMIAVDGIYPTPDTITSDLYPFISKTSAWFNADEPEDSAVRKIAAWCAGSAGKQMSLDLGYVPSGEHFEIPGYGEIEPLHDEILSVVLNNLTVSSGAEETESDNRTVRSSYFIVSGLKNKTAEEKINSAIAEKLESLVSEVYIPPVRGSEELSGYNVTDQSEYCYAEFNADNLLSVTISYLVTLYNEEADQYTYYEECIPMTFNLNTGNQISLSDLFDDQTAGLNFINSSIYSYIASNGYLDDYSDWDSITIVSPFKGVEEDQRFYIDENGEIEIVIDYNNPEFYVSNSYQCIEIDAASMVNYDTAFASEESLFEDESVNKMLIYRGYTSGQNLTEESRTLDDGTEVTIYKELNSSFTDGQLSVLEDLSAAEAEQHAKLLKNVELAEEGHPQSIEKNIYLSVYYTRASRYLTFIEQYSNYAEAYDDSGNCTSFYDTDTVYHCFDEGADEELLFVDVFAEGVDIRETLKDAMRKTLERNDVDISQPGIEGLLECAAIYARTFGLTQNEMLIQYEDLDGIIAKYLPNESSGNYYKYKSITNLRYSDLGAENLSIF